MVKIMREWEWDESVSDHDSDCEIYPTDLTSVHVNQYLHSSSNEWLWIMSIIRTHARNLIFAMFDAPASSFQSQNLILAILSSCMCKLTVRNVFDK